MTTSKVQHVCCLGSSFAAGPGIPPVDDVQAKRSKSNYAHQVAERFGSRITDLSVSGSTTLNIIRDTHTIVPGLAPQIERMPVDCDVVLITTGGNDIGYIGDLLKQSIRATWIGWFLFLVLQFLPIPKPEPLTLEELSRRIGNVCDAVHAKAPNARVFLVEYLALFGDDTAWAQEQIGLSNEEVQLAKQRADMLRKAYANTSKDVGRLAWCQTITMHEDSTAHAIGITQGTDRQPWVTGFSLYDAAILRKVPYHPTLEGMTACAQKIIERLE